MKEPIAIIGSACHFPGGADSPGKLWGLLESQKDVLRENSRKELNLNSFYHPDGTHHGTTNVPGKSYLLEDGHQNFDALFFNINPMEALAMDPQQKLLLETTYEAFERAGYTLEQMQNSSTSVFVGVMTSDFHDMQARDLETINRWHATGTAPTMLSNRISYCFNLKGPSLTINTACSSSLVALHQAVQSLRNGESSMAIVGGVNLLLDPGTFISESKIHMLSPTSRCRMWDQDADGYARGEGCAVVILKSLTHALADGDVIDAIVRETLVSSDGRSAGITMPDAEAQTKLIKQTYLNAGLDPIRDRCQYFECHGTGTQAGDPVKAQAIHQAFFADKPITGEYKDTKMHVGSIKIVIGHLEGCAGLAGVLKAVSCINHETITANLHFNTLNSKIAPFYTHLNVPTRNIPWPKVEGTSPLRASVNSFGFGGANAHAIIESAEAYVSGSDRKFSNEHSKDSFAIAKPFLISANSRPSLIATIERLARYVESNPSLQLNDLAWCLATKRSALCFKICLTADSPQSLLGELKLATSATQMEINGQLGTLTRRSRSEQLKVLGIFTGQGAQWATMGRKLILSCQLFANSIERCECALALLPDGPSWSLRTELMADKESSRLSESTFSQPLTTAIEIAIVDLLSAIGIELDGVIGHSSGEIAAAYAAGVISAEHAIQIAYYRGLHVGSPTGTGIKNRGAMMAVGMNVSQATELCDKMPFKGRIVIAAYNAPASVTLSGDYDAIQEAKENLDAKNVFARILKVETAYHSHHMELHTDRYMSSLKACNIQVRTPKQDCKWISTVQETFDFYGEGLKTLKDQYWVDNMLQPVRFSQAVESHFNGGRDFDLCVEVGPHSALEGPVSHIRDSLNAKKIPYLSLLKRYIDDVKATSSALGAVWEIFGPQHIDIARYLQTISSQLPRFLKDLPTYSWDHDQNFWREPRASRRYRLEGTRSHPLLGRRIPDDSNESPRWRNILHLNELHWLREYRHKGKILFPNTGYIALLVETAMSLAAGRSIALLEIQDLVVSKVIELTEEDTGVECISSLSILHQSSTEFSSGYLEAYFTCETCCAQTEVLERSCTARVILHFGPASAEELPLRGNQLEKLVNVNCDDFYHTLQSVGLEYRGAFQKIVSMARSPHHSVATVSFEGENLLSDYHLHPTLLEAAVQSLIGAFSSPLHDALCSAYIPMQATQVLINPHLSNEINAETPRFEIDATVTRSNSEGIEGEVSLFNLRGQSIVQVVGLCLNSTEEATAPFDRKIFSRLTWKIDPFLGSFPLVQKEIPKNDDILLGRIERAALFYLQNLVFEIDTREIPSFAQHHQLFYHEVLRLIESVKNNQHPTLKAEWLDDREHDIKSDHQRHMSNIELEIIHRIGPLLPQYLRQEIDAEKMINRNELERLYLESTSFSPMQNVVYEAVELALHKYPQMQILGLGTGAQTFTSKVQTMIKDNRFNGTFTTGDLPGDNTSPPIHLTADAVSFGSIDGMKNEAFDSNDVAESYDMIVLINTFNLPRTPTSSLRRMRPLLKPGGCIVLVETTGRMDILLFLIMGVTSSWWHKSDAIQPSCPRSTVSLAEWDQRLRYSGFSGVDGVSHDAPHPDNHCFSVIVSQAVDNYTHLLRQPKLCSERSLVPETLVILGGKTLPVCRLAHSLKNSFSHLGTAVRMVSTIEDFNMSCPPDGVSVISLTDLEYPHLTGELSHHNLSVLRSLLQKSKCTLWLTTGRISGQSLSNMTTGLGRAFKSETPSMILQFLDILKLETGLITTIMDVFLRLSWSHLPWIRDKDRLWLTEPEIHFDGQSLLVPRVVPDFEMNSRHKSTHLQSLQEFDIDQHFVEIKESSQVVAYIEKVSQNIRRGVDLLPFRTRFSVPLSPSVSNRLFLWLGTTCDGTCTALGLTERNTSNVLARIKDVYILDEQKATVELFRLAASFIFARHLALSTPSHGSILIYSPANSMTAAVQKSHRLSGRDIHFVSSKFTSIGKRWIGIHPRASPLALQRTLPKNVACFIDLSTAPNDSLRYTLRDMYRDVWKEFSISNIPSLGHIKIVQESCTEALAALNEPLFGSSDIFSVDEFSRGSASRYIYPAILDWTGIEKIHSQLRGTDEDHQFSSVKTYVMVNMTDPLGLSIITWMATRGARNFILINKYHVDQGFLEEMAALDTVIKVMKLDSTNKESMQSYCTEAMSSMPSIAGICIASMNLSVNMADVEASAKLETQLDPVIQSAECLSEIFSRPNLEFFVILSSLDAFAAVPYNPLDAASTVMMSGLIQRRRRKSLPGSILHIGMVVDVGYVARQKKETIQHMNQLGYATLSQSEIYSSFVQAIVSGAPDAHRGPELFVGLAMAEHPSDGLTKPIWGTNPLFSHFLRNENPQQEQLPDFSSMESTVMDQLQACTSKEKALSVLEKWLSSKVEQMLKIPSGTLDTDVPLLDFGFDSLTGLEVRSWFSQEIHVEIPAYTTLHSTISELCNTALEGFMGQKSEETLISENHSSHPVKVLSQNQPESLIPGRYQKLEEMSPYQSLIWFAANWMKDQSQYNVVISYNVEGLFDVERFEYALANVVSRHGSLRTAFFEDPVSGQLQQGVLEHSMSFFQHIDTSDPAIVSREFEKAATHQWQLVNGEVFRVTVVSVGEKAHNIIFSYHHIIMDGFSWSILLNDVKCFFELRPPHTYASQYIDYSISQNLAIRDGAFDKELSFWRQELSPLPDVMPLLPFAKSKVRESSDDYKTHTTTREIGKAIADQIKSASRDLRGTPFQFFMTCLQILFARLLEKDKICIGIGDANRKQSQFSSTVGYFVNVMPVQSDISRDDTFPSVFQRTTKKVLSVLSNSSVPSSLVLDALKVPRSSYYTPLFQVALNYRVGEITKLSLGKFELNYDRSIMGSAPYDISFHVTPTAAGTFLLDLTCRNCLYSPEAAEHILKLYTDLLYTFAPDPSSTSFENLLGPQKTTEPKISIRRGPRVKHHWPTTLPGRFEIISELFRDKIAVKQDSMEYSYAQLGSYVSRIENSLESLGVTRSEAIAVLCEPSVASVACMLAVLRLGGIYVPLDLSVPAARHSAMIASSGAKTLLCIPSTQKRATLLNPGHVLDVSSLDSHLDLPTEDKSSGTAPSVLLYTSGSTGEPKGVLLPQVGFINYLAAKEKELSLDSRVVVLQQSSIGFDMGLAQTLNSIMNGGKLVIVPQAARGDPIEIAKIIRKEEVTFTLATPSEYLALLQHARELLKGVTTWRSACLGGESFTDRLKMEFTQLGPNCPTVQDSYGVTEISACTSFETMSVSQVQTARSVGKAIQNTSLYVLDENQNPVDLGVSGEVCVGGVGIALGYLNEEQTRSKFLQDPFATPYDVDQGWTRLYRTGDRGCLMEDGSLIHMGRMDGNTEIKLRGLRIDLEDVGSTLVNSAPKLLSSAVVCVKGEGDDKMLVAYVALVPGAGANDDELRLLASKLPLPQYMCPTKVIPLDDLPRNSNGKIDRKKIESLPFIYLDPTAPQSTSSARLTLGEGELKLLWQKVLPDDSQIQPDSDFFTLGGNSLMLVKLQSSIRTSIGVALTLRDLYASSTLSSMAAKVDTEKAKSPVKTVNWFEETLVPEDIIASSDQIPLPRSLQSSDREILLTGSTSFLGKALVQALGQNHNVKRIHCVAVEEREKKTLAGDDKVIIYSGTLLDSSLGLSPDQQSALKACIDIVIHAGSNGHCLNFYNSLKKPNLLSTHFLARICLQGRIPMHFISSPRVILLSGKASLGPISLSSHPPPADGSEGLTASKWASESFLEAFAERTGSPVVIHRPCTAIGENAPHQDALNSMLRYSNIMGATPHMTNMDGYLDFQNVEVLAHEIVSQVMVEVSGPCSSVKICHYSSNTMVPVHSFKDYMQQVHKRPFEEFSLEDWSTRALELGIEPLIPSFLEAVAENTETMFFPYLGTDHSC